MYSSILKIIAALVLIISTSAQAMEFEKPLTASIPVTSQPSYRTQSVASVHPTQALKKTVMLMRVKLTRHQKQLLNKNQAEATLASSPPARNSNLPRQYDRGMNGTPVLDQGLHGTCTTFADTGAIDALLGKGDYVSQLCNLQLGSYFEEKGYVPSGWDGTMGPLPLNQMLSFGIISKPNQRIKTCGGLRDYPLMNPYSIGYSMSLEDFKKSSENLNEMIYWEPLLTYQERFNWAPENTAEAEALLTEIKNVLSLQEEYVDTRLTVGVLIPVEYCSAGACARYHTENDTWALTNTIQRDEDAEMGGHEMIITGYNDDAVVLDNEGNKHQGLLILRNSWGREAGDQGNFYMTYDYFKLFVMEVQKIVIEK